MPIRRRMQKTASPTTKQSSPGKRKLGPRKNRVFNYRGYTFLIRNKGGGVAGVSILDPDSGNAEHQADVPTEKAREACYELVKIAMAEEALQKLQRAVKQPSKVKWSSSEDAEIEEIDEFPLEEAHLDD